MSGAAGPSPSAAQPPAAPWYATALFHLVNALVAIGGALAWLKFGGDPTIATTAFGAGVAFLGVGAGVAVVGSSGSSS